MDAYNYIKIIQELCLLPNKIIDFNADSIVIPKEVVKEEVKEEVKETKEEVKEIKGGYKIKTLPVLNSSNYTLIEPLKLLTRSMKGGNVNLNFDQINTLVYNNSKHLSLITKFYYDNYKQIMNSNQIIMVLVSFIYNEFTDDLKDVLSIITPEYIKSIPEMYVFNFTDKVMGDLLKECPNIKEKFNILDENIKVLETNENQKGGGKSNKRIDTSNDKTVEEKIKNNINILTTFLKSKRTNKQLGGALANLGEISRDIAAFTPTTDKMKIREMQEKSNMWVVELLEEKMAEKIIKDDEHNIARYYLQSTNPGLKIIIDFLNDNASILTLKDDDRIKVNLPNQLPKTLNYGSSQPTYVTDKLKEYFNKKYDELLKIRALGENKENKVPTEPLAKIQFILSQKGGLITKKNDEFEEKCFTSKQLGLFLRKVSLILRDSGKVIDDSDITSIQSDIEKLKQIEENLIKNYKIFENYIKIQDVYPDTGVKEITISHMKNVIDNNQQLFDSYGNINTELLDVIKKVERYSNIKEYFDELNELSQSGGNFSNQKSYLKFNTQYDIEHFTARNFQKILEEMKKDD